MKNKGIEEPTEKEAKQTIFEMEASIKNDTK